MLGICCIVIFLCADDSLHQRRTGTKSLHALTFRFNSVRENTDEIYLGIIQSVFEESTTYILERNRYLYRFARTVFKSIEHLIYYLNFVGSSTIDLSQRIRCCKLIVLNFNIQFLRKLQTTFRIDFSDLIFYV